MISAKRCGLLHNSWRHAEIVKVQRIEQLAAQIERRKIERATEASMEDKMLDGPRLFRLACEAVKAGLRLDHPGASEAEIQQLLIERVYPKS